ncbi:AMP-dependent synthetase/ligase [Aquimarina agarilytica]|uniref:AMP-dependent synthetase/ligase n=1 Tax=Aquimarina agarilytica TaxID=1087449 RepID=UPI0002882857|nr:AMP-dependent synthetase/ligase [Aquimarina agarilytica]
MTEIKRLFDFPYYQLDKGNLSNALVTKVNGVWEETSTQDYINKANQISRGLLRLGVKPNDKIAIISTNNRTEWNIVDIGVLQIGAQDVPIYPTISEEDYQYVLNHSESTYVFVSDDEVYTKVMNIKDQVPSIKGVYSFDTINACANWSEVLELGKDDSNQNEVQNLMDSINENDLATLIYTSGTTGRPKGVMLSHRNIVRNAINSSKRFDIDEGNAKALSFLPVCHVYERMLLYLYQYRSISIYFAESIEAISDNLKEVKPDVMTAVPRLLEKVYDKIYAKGTALTGIKKKLFFWAIDLGLIYEPYGQNGAWYEFKLGIARKLIFSKWQEGLGGNLKIIASGSAALQSRLARVFNAAGINVMEGYGLTETSPVISVNDIRNNGFKIGTVGKVLDETTVTIAEDGEILVEGASVMMGYYKNPEKTAEEIQNGKFHTGDIGEIDSEGFLKITDRKKEMFKTSGGKYVAPQVVENTIKQSPFIEQLMVIGEGEKMPAAFIQPNFSYIKDWAEIKNITIGNSFTEICQNADVIKRIKEEVDQYNAKFGKWEQVKRFELTPVEWSVDSGHLTPTFKLKRKIIKEIHKDLYTEIYG